MDKTFERKCRDADWAMIVEMMEASMALSGKKGLHPLTQGCNCIVCINKRKDILKGPPRPWRYRL